MTCKSIINIVQNLVCPNKINSTIRHVRRELLQKYTIYVHMCDTHTQWHI